MFNRTSKKKFLPFNNDYVAAKDNLAKFNSLQQQATCGWCWSLRPAFSKSHTDSGFYAVNLFLFVFFLPTKQDQIKSRKMCLTLCFVLQFENKNEQLCVMYRMY